MHPANGITIGLHLYNDQFSCTFFIPTPKRLIKYSPTKINIINIDKNKSELNIDSQSPIINYSVIFIYDSKQKYQYKIPI